ncbi:MAG TPA: threonine/serine dehydratase [Nitrolancea sp.]|jgi:threonine dehydratase|nr:threonine/serine dehydratase [Nitrolancea sp.]
MSQYEPTLIDIIKAEQQLRPHLWDTTARRSPALSERFKTDIYLKPENLQRMGSFKIRGAFNRVTELATAGATAVVTASAGNHGQGVVYAANAAGLRATIIVPKTASEAKIEALRRMGAELRLMGTTFDEAEDAAYEFAVTHALPVVSPYDAAVIAGQGTVGYELLVETPDLDLLLIPVSAGGLLAGCAIAAKAMNSNIQIVGVQTEASPSMVAALRAGRIVNVPCVDSLADGLGGNIARGQLPFSIIQRLVDDVVLVGEESIAAAMRLFAATERMIVEGAGAVGLAALLDGRIDVSGKRVGLVISGGNVSFETLRSVFTGPVPL